MAIRFEPNLWVIMLNSKYRFNEYLECMIVGLNVFTRGELESGSDPCLLVGINPNGHWDLMSLSGQMSDHIVKFSTPKGCAIYLCRMFKRHTFETAGTTMWSYLNETMEEDCEKYGDDCLDNPEYWVSKFDAIAFDAKYHQHEG